MRREGSRRLKMAGLFAAGCLVGSAVAVSPVVPLYAHQLHDAAIRGITAHSNTLLHLLRKSDEGNSDAVKQELDSLIDLNLLMLANLAPHETKTGDNALFFARLKDYRQ